MKNILLILVYFILLAACNNTEKRNLKSENYFLYVSPFKSVLSDDNHTSEGFLAPLKDGNILLIFRLDPGIKGDHTGTDGYIAKIKYDPVNDKWSEVETVYNSNRYDDRNIHGGVTKDGRIVVFFRRYDTRETEGRYFIFSDDKGKTWTDPQISKAWSDPALSNFSGVWSTGQMFFNPDISKYIMPGCQRYITYSRDGSSWEEYSLITDNRDFKLTEIAAAWCGNNRIIALIRDDVRKYGHPLVQTESYDNGLTWTVPIQTNIPPKMHWGAAPQLIYDEKRDLLIALNSDRYSRANEQNSLFIYTAHPDNILGNSKAWKLEHELRRPFSFLNYDGDRPLNQNLYGYCTIAPINENEYLVVFTERSIMHGTEQADLYYFKIILSP